MDLHNKKLFFPIVILGLVIVGLLMFIAVSIYNHYYGMKHIRSQQVSPEVGEDEYNIVFKGQFNGIAFVEDGYLYFDMDVVNEDWAMGRYFYSDVENVVFFTTSTERISYEIGSEFYKQRNGHIFVRASECEDRCGLQYKINYDEQLVMIRDPQGRTAEVMTSGVYLLTDPSPETQTYTAKLKKGETIEIYPCDTEGYYFASDMNGHMGYLEAEGLKTSKANLSRKESQQIDMSDYLVKTDTSLWYFIRSIPTGIRRRSWIPFRRAGPIPMSFLPHGSRSTRTELFRRTATPIMSRMYGRKATRSGHFSTISSTMI